MLKNVFLFFLFLFISIFKLTAQKQEVNFWDNVRFGGGLNVGFSSNNTTISVSPSAIYDFSDSFSSGISLSYLYSNNKTYNSTLNVYGASVITLFEPLYSFQLSAEFEEMKIKINNGFNQNYYWNPALYFGGAYRTGNISVGLRYDVLYNENKSIYSSPITPVFRIYF